MQPDSRLLNLPIPLSSVHPWCQKVKPLSANRWKQFGFNTDVSFQRQIMLSVPRIRVFTHAKSREGLYGTRASWQLMLFQQKKYSRPSEHISLMIVAGKHILQAIIWDLNDYSVRFH